MPWGTGSPQEEHEGKIGVMDMYFMLIGVIVLWMYICQYSSSCKHEVCVFSSVQIMLQLTASKLKLRQKIENCMQPNTTKLVEVT